MKNLSCFVLTALLLSACSPSEDATESQIAALAPAPAENLFKRERSLAQYLDASGFPSLRLKVDGEVYPITVDYENYQVSLDEILKLTGKS